MKMGKDITGIDAQHPFMTKSRFLASAVILHLVALSCLVLFIIWPNFYFGFSSAELTAFHLILMGSVALHVVSAAIWSRESWTRLLSVLWPIAIPMAFYLLLRAGNFLLLEKA
jgi:hypothetical protein